MKRYNVHIYREMRLVYLDIEAESPEEAAATCREFPGDEACGPAVDCDGEAFAALVDVQGDLDYAQSLVVEFEGERCRKAVPALLEALNDLLEQTVEQDIRHGIELTEGEQAACSGALAAIASAMGLPRAAQRSRCLHRLRNRSIEM